MFSTFYFTTRKSIASFFKVNFFNYNKLLFLDNKNKAGKPALLVTFDKRPALALFLEGL
jgi:hypothetical protein